MKNRHSLVVAELRNPKSVNTYIGVYVTPVRKDDKHRIAATFHAEHKYLMVADFDSQEDAFEFGMRWVQRNGFTTFVPELDQTKATFFRWSGITNIGSFKKTFWREAKEFLKEKKV